MMEGVPQNIGRYQVEEKLGEGAMSLVYKAFDEKINRHIAIKLLRPDMSASAEYRSRFISESKAAGQLGHPHIVTIHDVGMSEFGPYMAMEHLDGPTLENVMAQGSPLAIEKILDIGIQLADALDYSHARGVVHRDVKPSNIMFKGSDENIKITDFGIARIDNPDMTQRTRVGTILGTPQYMSPEQVEGTEPADARSDLFSVGVILYQLLTGDKPFEAKTLNSLYVSILTEDPKPIRERNKNVPVPLVNIVEKLLNKDKYKRYQSGKELANALRNVLVEIKAIDERSAEAKRLPLRIKWTLTLVMFVTLVIGASAYWIHKREVAALTELALDFGSSLTEFVALESAELVVRQDWVAVETFVQEAGKREQLDYLRVIDWRDIVRGSTIVAEQGESYRAPGNRVAVDKSGDVDVFEVVSGGKPLFEFETAIVYLGKQVGRIQLGLQTTALRQASQMIMYTMIGVTILVILTVAVSAYVLASRLSVPFRTLRDALRQIQAGNLQHRIDAERNDEMGQLFEEFNAMAAAVEQRKEELTAVPRSFEGTQSGHLETAPEALAATKLAEDSGDASDDSTRLMGAVVQKSADRNESDA